MPADTTRSHRNQKGRDTRADWRDNVAYPEYFKRRRTASPLSLRGVIATLKRTKPSEPEDWELFI